MPLSGNIWKFDLMVECNQGGVQQQVRVQFCRKDIGAHLSVFAQISSVLHLILFTIFVEPVVKATGGPACCSALHFFYLQYFFLSMGVPNGSNEYPQFTIYVYEQK